MAGADPRTVKRFIERLEEGHDDRGLVSDRVRSALASAGFLPSEGTTK